MDVVEAQKVGGKAVKVLGPVNGGTRMSWNRCETNQNINGKGNAKLSDSLMGYLDPKNDGAWCLCACI